jgi:hypothetical protein
LSSKLGESCEMADKYCEMADKCCQADGYRRRFSGFSRQREDTKEKTETEQGMQAIQTPSQRLGSVPNLERQASTSSGPKFSGTKLFKEAT